LLSNLLSAFLSPSTTITTSITVTIHIMSHRTESMMYNGMTMTYSGFNGVDSGGGSEFIDVQGKVHQKYHFLRCIACIFAFIVYPVQSK
jgi:hypothetical protein